jgi:cytoskeletal protein RodZ
MPTVAEQLRLGREARGLTIQQVADITKIRADHLRALEEGNYEVFTAPVYIRGFVRSCSTLLKLEVPQLMSTLEEELSRTAKFAEPPPLTGYRRGVVDGIMLQLSKVDWRSGLLALACVILFASLLTVHLVRRHYRNANPLAGLKPGVYQSGSNAPGETLPLPAPAPSPRR